MAKIKKRKLSWIESGSSQVIGYKLYWSNNGAVDYDSKSEMLGNVTEIVLPDDVKSFKPNGGPVRFGVTAVDERIGVYCFLEGLAQQVLPALRVGDVLVYDEDDVVGGQTFGGGEKPHVPHHQATLVRGKRVRAAPHLDVLLHVDFFWRPVVGHAVFVMFARPLVTHRQNLVGISCRAVE